LAARALPPFAPPSFPSATAAGFFSGPFGAGSGSASPVAISATILASWFGSRGMLERLCMLRVWNEAAGEVKAGPAQTETLLSGRSPCRSGARSRGHQFGARRARGPKWGCCGPLPRLSGPSTLDSLGCSREAAIPTHPPPGRSQGWPRTRERYLDRSHSQPSPTFWPGRPWPASPARPCRPAVGLLGALPGRGEHSAPLSARKWLCLRVLPCLVAVQWQIRRAR